MPTSLYKHKKIDLVTRIDEALESPKNLNISYRGGENHPTEEDTNTPDLHTLKLDSA